LTEETSASSIYYLQLRVDRFIIDFVLNLIINILIGFGCRADHFSNTDTAASREFFFNPNYALDFIRKEIRQNSSEAHEQRKKLISEISI
jgi:hypothetical protein